MKESLTKPLDNSDFDRNSNSTSEEVKNTVDVIERSMHRNSNREIFGLKSHVYSYVKENKRKYKKINYVTNKIRPF